MTLIFSQSEVDGLKGTYSNPAYFTGVFDAGTKEVITDREDIAEAAKSKGIKVKGFTKQPPPKAEVTIEPKPSVDVIEEVTPTEEVVEAPKPKRTRKTRVKKDS